MKVAVCDDNKVMLKFLSRQVTESLTSNEVVHEISNFKCGEEFISQHENTPFDVVFLDIRLPDIDGFEVAKRAKRISDRTYIIFVTTYSSLVYDSFDYHPYYFKHFQARYVRVEFYLFLNARSPVANACTPCSSKPFRQRPRKSEPKFRRLLTAR